MHYTYRSRNALKMAQNEVKSILVPNEFVCAPLNSTSPMTLVSANQNQAKMASGFWPKAPNVGKNLRILKIV